VSVNCCRRASELLRLAEQGHTIEVTDRGRPVALLTPLPRGSVSERMLATGEIEPAGGDIGDLPPPLPPCGTELPSQVLARLRRDER
jgi:antitoxin (DNA-binding transcriptional repressor) of toxin-antitoxin stability system